MDIEGFDDENMNSDYQEVNMDNRCVICGKPIVPPQAMSFIQLDVTYDPSENIASDLKNEGVDPILPETVAVGYDYCEGVVVHQSCLVPQLKCLPPATKMNLLKTALSKTVEEVRNA